MFLFHPWKHKKTFYLMFLGGSNSSIEKKWVKVISKKFSAIKLFAILWASLTKRFLQLFHFIVISFSNYKFPAGSYMFKVNNRSTRKGCQICSKLTIKTTERRHWRSSAVIIVDFEYISHLVLVFLLWVRSSKVRAKS